MYEQFFKQASETLRKFGALAVDHAQKLAQFQLDTFDHYAGLGLEELRGAAAIKDNASFQAHVGKQGELAKKLSRRLTEDTQTMLALGSEFSTGLQKATAPFLVRTRSS